MQRDPFHIRSHVADFDVIVDEILRRSAAARRALPMAADLAYGTGPAETVDLFFPPGPRHSLPVHLFIHGGYWRMFSKRDYAMMAESITTAGAIAVILDYDLMPGARLATLVDQTRRAAGWIGSHVAEFGGDPERLSVSGHSAGAHLATFLLHAGRERPAIREALLLGGLYDLKPLQHSFLQEEIGLTDEEVARFTPLTQDHDPACRANILVGGEETAPFHDQASRFADHLRSQGLSVQALAVEGENHMSSVLNLGIPGNALSQALQTMIART
ncbi:alpha/beta hydrolase [Rhizobium sp. YIM 134829]|uniref:alpha/beta hydrolase n=1 Tax=Rhizobium sp. YIM 134829 TaxID=3390453 RepID=UPI00397BC7BE